MKLSIWISGLLILFSFNVEAEQCHNIRDATLLNPQYDQVQFENFNLRHRGKVAVSLVSEGGKVFLVGRVIELKGGQQRELFRELVPELKDQQLFLESTAILISDYYHSMSFHEYTPSPIVAVSISSHRFLGSASTVNALAEKISNLPNRRSVQLDFNYGN